MASFNSRTCYISKQLRQHDAVYLIPYGVFHTIVSLHRFPQWYYSVLKCTACSRVKQSFVSVLHTSCYRQQIKLDCVTQVLQCNCTRDGSTCSVRVMHWLVLYLPRSIGNF